MYLKQKLFTVEYTACSRALRYAFLLLVLISPNFCLKFLYRWETFRPLVQCVYKGAITQMSGGVPMNSAKKRYARAKKGTHKPKKGTHKPKPAPSIKKYINQQDSPLQGTGGTSGIPPILFVFWSSRRTREHVPQFKSHRNLLVGARSAKSLKKGVVERTKTLWELNVYIRQLLARLVWESDISLSGFHKRR